mgnify:CR=1 FL=1
MSKKDNLRLQINEDSQLEPMLCSIVSCDNPLTGQRRKYCSETCRVKAMSTRASELNKGVYSALGENSGPRSMISKSSIRKDETHVTGNGEFVVDDYHVDPDIFAIAEANHEQYVLDRNEHEARVVIDGLSIFQEEYNKNHDVSYQSEQAKKHEANLTEDEKKTRSIKNKIYQIKNKEKISRRARERYKANPEKYRKIHKAYYQKNKDKIKKFHKKYYRENVRKPDLFMFEQWLKKRTSGS